MKMRIKNLVAVGLWIGLSGSVFATMLYIDSGAMCSLRIVNGDDYLYDLGVWNMKDPERVEQVHLCPTVGILMDDLKRLSHINVPWSVDKGDLHVFAPTRIGAMGDIDFNASEIKDVYLGFASPEDCMSNVVIRYRGNKVIGKHEGDIFNLLRSGIMYGNLLGETMACGDIVIHAPGRYRGEKPCSWRSDFFIGSAINNPLNKVVWVALDGKRWIARFPFSGKKDSAWRPCSRPSQYKWAADMIDFEKNNGDRNLSITEIDFEGNEYDPCNAVWVTGRHIKSDNPQFAVPDKADWLIWEKDGDKSRLCKMHGGKWSVVTNAPCSDVPSMIVVNNDEGSVFLSFLLKFDEDDVGASMRRVAGYLKEHGALHPDKLKIPARNPGDELSSFAKGLREDAAEQARLIEENRRMIAEARARMDREHEEANRRAEAAWRRTGEQEQPPREGLPQGVAEALKTADETARKGAALYEHEETRKEGIALLRKSADAGNPFALARLSALYYLGEGGVAQDYETAFKLMKKAAMRGFPFFLLPMAEAKARAECQKAARSPVSVKLVAKPGFGYKGTLKPYRASSRLKEWLAKYNLSAGWFVRDGSALEHIDKDSRKSLSANKIPYLLFKPENRQKRVPMLVYFGGLGEQGTDLEKQFNQKTIFEKITSKAFQDKHPCYLFAPMVSTESSLRCMMGWHPPDADLVCDAMYALVRENVSPCVDTNRLYLTGLSIGGSTAYTFPFGYPGRFAASVPVAGYAHAISVCKENPGHIWLFGNEGEYSSMSMRRTIDEMEKTIKERGGEFRFSTFPDKGHNAWDKAWQEDTMWEWMFSKTADGRGVPGLPVGGATVRSQGQFVPIMGAKCTASKPGKDATTRPEMAIDGLDATCYVSAEPLRKGEFWAIEFGKPIKGRIAVKTGYRNGKSIVAAAHVETSNTGRSWSRCGGFARDTGVFHLTLNSPVRYLRVVSDSTTGEILVLREINILE